MRDRSRDGRHCARIGLLILVLLPLFAAALSAQEKAPSDAAGSTSTSASAGASSTGAAKGAAPRMMGLWEMLEAGGFIGYVIMFLSVAMVALIVEHLISIRASRLMPPGLATKVSELLLQGHAKTAEQVCTAQPSFLASVLKAGLVELSLGHAAIEKAMEDASQEQAARLYRKIDYVSVIGTIAPMLGLLGTVWGMILAFMEFELKANPQVSELAPGIYKALVTTLQGLCVAIPAMSAFAWLRNRIDELVAETSLTAAAVFTDYRRAVAHRKRTERRPRVEPVDLGEDEATLREPGS